MKIRIALLTLFLLGSSYSINAQNSDPTKEPKASITITINGKKYNVTEGEDLKLNETIKNPNISVALAKHRTFKNNKISFNYPNHFAFEYEGSIGYKNWTFDGNNYVIMYFQVDNSNTLDDYINQIASRFGRQNCKIVPHQLKLGNRSLKGKRLKVNLMGEKLNMDFVEIANEDGEISFIAFQDSPNDDGSPSDEGVNALKMINKTISYK